MTTIADQSNMPDWDIPWTALAIIASLAALLLLAGLVRAMARPAPTKYAPPAQDTPAPVPAGATNDDPGYRAAVHQQAVTDLCMVLGCPNPWSTSRHGWNTCPEHTTPQCKACQRKPATQLYTLCAECHARITKHFDEFVDQALAIVNGDQVNENDEAAEADYHLWELESGWATS
jgi:hypothetical protein